MHTQSGARVRGALSEARARGLEAADRGCPGAPDIRTSGRFPGNSEPEEGVFSTLERKQILFQELSPSHSPFRPSAHLPSPPAPSPQPPTSQGPHRQLPSPPAFLRRGEGGVREGHQRKPGGGDGGGDEG